MIQHSIVNITDTVIRVRSQLCSGVLLDQVILPVAVMKEVFILITFVIITVRGVYLLRISVLIQHSSRLRPVI